MDWLVDDNSAVRLHIANPEGEWRCALIVLKPSTSAINTIMGGSAQAAAAASAAEVRGIWYDGGSNANTNGLHDCAPSSSRGTVAFSATATGNLTCTIAASNVDNDDCLPVDAQTWHIPVIAGETDSSSTSVTAGDVRTLHRSASSLDSNA